MVDNGAPAPVAHNKHRVCDQARSILSQQLSHAENVCLLGPVLAHTHGRFCKIVTVDCEYVRVTKQAGQQQMNAGRGRALVRVLAHEQARYRVEHATHARENVLGRTLNHTRDGHRDLLFKPPE